MIEIIEQVVGRKAIIDSQLEEQGVVLQTWANVTLSNELFGYKPTTSLRLVVRLFMIGGKVARNVWAFPYAVTILGKRFSQFKFRRF